eukprot:Skav208155  [mRNA]  locus=scaffold2891:65139:70098:+ [translate_table: standard]
MNHVSWGHKWRLEALEEEKMNLAMSQLDALVKLGTAADESKQNGEAEKLKSEATAKGGIAMDAMEAAESAQEEVEAAAPGTYEKAATDAKTAAEEAQSELIEANAKAEASEQHLGPQRWRKFLDAKSDLDRKAEVAALVKDGPCQAPEMFSIASRCLRIAMAVTTGGRMEKIYDESEGKPDAQPAHEHMRTNPDVKAALAPRTMRSATSCYG